MTMAAPSAKLSPLLLSAISQADASTLKSVLIFMCESSPACTAAASQRLLVTRMHEIIDLEDGDEAETGPARKKLKRENVVAAEVSRYETCGACHKRFDVMRNGEDACQLHHGEIPFLWGMLCCG